MDWGPRITYLASTALKELVVPFGIKDNDRLKHVCVIGKVGSGRAAFLSRMALQDTERSLGTMILDASGNLAPVVMERLDQESLKRLIHIDAADAEYPFSWDIVGEFKKTDKGPQLFKDVLASVYGVVRSPLTDFLAEYILNSADRTILDACTLLSDEKERDAAFPPETDAAKKFLALRESEKECADTLIENGRYLIKDTMIRNVVGQKEGKFTLASLAEGAIVVVDLSRIRIFPTRIAPLVKLFTYAMRAQTSAGTYASLYIHDCIRYYSDDDAEALMGDQSFALSLSDTVYREGDLPFREKVLSRCGSVVAFEPHTSDVSLVQKVFYPYVTPEELSGLETGEACVALTIDSVRSRPFFANALELPARQSISLQDILVAARQKYTTPRTQVDATFKKGGKDDTKKGGPPGQFNDAFKNIFAKRDPNKALAPTGDKKPDPARPVPETGVQQSIMQTLQSAVAPQPVLAPQAVPAVMREIPEDDLRALLYVSPRPA